MNWPSLLPYVDAGILLPLDLYCAERILSQETEVKEEEIALCAVLLALSRQGHLALSLDKMEEILTHLSAKPSCDMQRLASMVRCVPMARLASFKKCIKQENGHLYLQKSWEIERQIAHHLLRLLRSTPLACAPVISSEKGMIETAIARAMASPVSLLFGGPGTGKTYTAARLIQAFLSLDVQRSMRIVIAAPTGKAVTQLNAYVRQILPGDQRIRSGTCHALLGLKKEKKSEGPKALLADVILIDECSMIDAPLFAHLLAAVLEGSRLILIGDPDQLPSVEAGSIFADLVTAAQETGSIVPYTHLKQSVRVDRQDILSFADEIRRGESTQAITRLKAHSNITYGKELTNAKWNEAPSHNMYVEDEPSMETSPKTDLSHRFGIQWIELAEQNRISVYTFLLKLYKDRFPGYFLEKPQGVDLMDKLEKFRLLSCMRKGCFGVDAINDFFFEQFINNVKGYHWWAIPILITQNDYALQLYNGDSGFLVRRVSDLMSLKNVTPEDYAVFYDRLQGQESFRTIPALALPAFELSYCLSVHKSQGSEYDEALILIPQGSEIFGREILYTAITRSKRSIICAGSLETIERLIQNSARKISGLSARLQIEFNRLREA